MNCDVSTDSFCFKLRMMVIAIGFLSGCETAAPWVDPAAAKHEQDPIVELSEYVPMHDEKKQRTAVVCDCDATTMNDFSSFVATPETHSIDNGTAGTCPRPPCAIERGSDAKGETATVYFDLRSYDYAGVLDEPSLTITGLRKGSATATISTKTFGPLISIPLHGADDKVAITVDTSDFTEISSATLSWASPKKDMGSGTHQDLQQYPCICCEYSCTVVNGANVCTCTWHGPYESWCP